MEADKQRKLAASGAFPDPLATNCGEVPLEELQSKEVTGRIWTEVRALTEELKDQKVLVRGRAQTVHAVSKKMAFLVLREKGSTVQCVLSMAPDLVSLWMVKFVNGLSRESYVDVEGTVLVPSSPIKGASQQGVGVSLGKKNLNS